MTQVVWAPQAIQDVEAIRAHVARDSARYADLVVERIADNPLAYADRYRGARRALLRRFPYVLWYRVLESFVVVLACVHGKRGPRVIRARLR